MPVPEPRKPGVDRYAPKPGDSEPVIQWRRRMAIQGEKAIFSQWGSTIETIKMRDQDLSWDASGAGARFLEGEPRGPWMCWRTTSSILGGSLVGG